MPSSDITTTPDLGEILTIVQKRESSLQSELVESRQREEDYRNKLKVCRAAMRRADIGDQYPGANPRTEQDWKNNPERNEQNEYRAEMMIEAQADVSRLRYENNELRQYISRLELALDSLGHVYNKVEISTHTNTAKLLLNKYMGDTDDFTIG